MSWFFGGSPQGSEKFEHNMAEFPKIRVKLLYAKVRNSMPPAAPKMLPMMILCKLNSYDDKAKEHIRSCKIMYKDRNTCCCKGFSEPWRKLPNSHVQTFRF